MSKPTEKPATLLFDFVLEKAVTELPARRAKLYRALASVIGVEKEARALLTLATACDKVDRQHRQLVLNFRRRAEG